MKKRAYCWVTSELNGKGIAKAERPLLFRRFGCGGAGNARLMSSAGLGLSIC